MAAVAGATIVRPARAKVLGANDRIGIGFIGCGGRADNHMVGLTELRTKGENIELVAGCDVYAPRVAHRSKKFGFKMYRTCQEVLQDPKVDAVVISSPDHHHAQQAIEAVRAGKDVYCEKPVSHWRQFEITRQLAREVSKSRQVFMLGTQYLSDSAWRQARELVASGAIGKPIHAECGYFRTGDWGERGMPIDDPNARPGPELDWEAFLGDSPKRPFDVSRFFRWRMYMDYAGGPSTDLFPHFMTQTVYMMGLGLPSTVTATGGKFRYQEREVPDTFNILIDYPEKVTLAVLGTQGNDYSGHSEYCGGMAPIIRGWDGTITFQGTDVVHRPGDGSKPVRLIRVEQPFSQENYYREWIACMRSRKQPISNAELAYHVQTALQMAMLSWHEGKIARFDPKEEKIVLA